MKFGGTSVGTSESMSKVVEIVLKSRDRWPRLVIITSALATVTNLLLESATGSARGDTQEYAQNAERLRELHIGMLNLLVPQGERFEQTQQEIEQLISEFCSRCQAISVLGEATPRALDAVTSLGERLSLRLLTAALQARGIPAQSIEATQLIVTDNCFQNAHPDFTATKLNSQIVLEPVLDKGEVAVVTGFIAATLDGITTTLGRGGSDFTAGILGAVLPADEVWIWTDVDGVLTADPRVEVNAFTIPEITYREIAELAFFGAKVLHPKTIRPVINSGTKLRILNTFNPEHPGTRLITDTPEMNGRKQNNEVVVKAVTAIYGQRLITVEGRGMLGVPGVAARTFGAVASTGTSVPLISQASSEQSICFAVPSDSVSQVIASLEKAFESEIAKQDIDRIWTTEEVAIITVVGAGMIQVFTTLGEMDVNVIAIAQGSSEVSISLIVDKQDAEKAVRAIHALILSGRDNYDKSKSL